MKHTDIAIIGAGVAGLSVALALSRQGFSRVRIYERAQHPGETGAGLQLGPNAVRELGKLGLAGSLAQLADSALQGEMRQGDNNRLLARLPYSDYFRRTYGVPAYQILRTDLHNLLLNAVRDQGVAIDTGKELLTSVSGVDGVRLEFADGVHAEAKMAIAADGINSVVVDQGFPENSLQYSGYACWRALIDRDSLGENWSGLVRVWTGSGKHLVTYPVDRGRKLNLVAIADYPDWTSAERARRSDKSEWLQAYADWSPEVLNLIDQVGEAQLWALFERNRLPVWHRGRCVLIGDAAHPMLPSLAQGAAQAIEDANLIAAMLGEASEDLAQDDLEKLLASYYRRRHQRVERVQASAQWNLNYFHRGDSALRRVRNLAMRAAGPLTTSLIARRYHWLYGESG